MWTSFVSSGSDMDIAYWDTAHDVRVGFGLKCKYDVGGMKSGGLRGVDWCTVCVFWSIGS